MNYLLHAYIETAGESAEERTVNHLMFNPTEDGGQWGMLVNLIVKHGVIPKSCFPDAWSSRTTRKPFNYILNHKVFERSCNFTRVILNSLYCYYVRIQLCYKHV